MQSEQVLKDRLQSFKLTTTEGFSCIGVVDVLDKKQAVSAGNWPPGSGLPLARLNNAYDILLPRFNTAWTPGKERNN